MNVIELERVLRQLRLGGMASVLETRLRQAQAEPMAPIDLISCLVSDELTRRSDRLLERRRKQAGFRDPDRTLDNFDFTFNPKMNRSLVFDLATGAFINKREDALFLGPGGTGKSHLAQAIGQAAIQQGCKVFYRETHILLDERAEAVADGTRKEYMEMVAMVRYSSSTTSACANSHTPLPRICWKLSCAATNASAHCSHPTVRSKTGASYSAMSPQ
jgi:DNA replication protein DnaC